MPAARRHRHSPKKQAPAPKRPLPRITDPYAPPDPFIEPAELEEEEPERILHNRKVQRLLKLHALTPVSDKAKEANASIACEREWDEANWKTWVPYDDALEHYENKYGKFVPGAENAAWFARKEPRVAELMVLRHRAGKVRRHNHTDMLAYFAAAHVFEDDFGHAFSCGDGLDDHFKQMESHTITSHALKTYYTAEEVEEVLSTPLEFTIRNPYYDDDWKRNRFDAILRSAEADHSAQLKTSPHPARTPAIISHCDPDAPDWHEWHLEQHYKRVWIRDLLEEIERHHFEAWSDTVGEKRLNVRLPFVKCPSLW
ncbi:hypothetical protein FB451DRAFT_1175524 [Mycena latifolia]|nr:hypothetical protein FB451DRAFT_1175524 [Mycena latifolia]